MGEIAISSITRAELAYGVAKRASSRNELALEKFLVPLNILPFDAVAMQQCGLLRAQLELQGKSIGPLDLLIAAHALALCSALVTNNPREFERVPDLPLENWVS